MLSDATSAQNQPEPDKAYGSKLSVVPAPRWHRSAYSGAAKIVEVREVTVSISIWLRLQCLDVHSTQILDSTVTLPVLIVY